jgi:site-specific DNA-methyltransferase (adenine-specific)
MGKRWDYDVPSVEIWAECLRVLKPGGHLLAFAGTRTQHRMAVRIEDAGFEIRDMIAWVYGSGFPKSLDVSKAIDKAAGAEREVVGSKVTGRALGGSNWREGDAGGQEVVPITAPATPEAQQWAGWGTALKPALEPITVARKPLTGTVAANVLEHGTGALNVDGCRVTAAAGDEPLKWEHGRGMGFHGAEDRGPCAAGTSPGRWPANLIHDGSDEVVGLFPAQDGRVGMRQHGSGTNSVYGKFDRTEMSIGNGGVNDTGSAARFFYTAKASKADRGEGNTHPTVKPLDLMAYLCRLVTPPGGVVLDPFMGSGTTIKAAIGEGFHAIGIERDPAYFAMVQQRMDGAQLGLPIPSAA